MIIHKGNSVYVNLKNLMNKEGKRDTDFRNGKDIPPPREHLNEMRNELYELVDAIDKELESNERLQ